MNKPQWKVKREMRARKTIEERKVNKVINWKQANDDDFKLRSEYMNDLTKELGYSPGKLNKIIERIRASWETIDENPGR